MSEKDKFMKYVEICERAEKEGFHSGERTTLLMDIENADKVFGLDLEAWLNAGSGDFAHDLCGIVENIERTTFPTVDFGLFVPRFIIREPDCNTENQELEQQ